MKLEHNSLIGMTRAEVIAYFLGAEETVGFFVGEEFTEAAMDLIALRKADALGHLRDGVVVAGEKASGK
jgi:hypothetical protein